MLFAGVKATFGSSTKSTKSTKSPKENFDLLGVVILPITK